MNGPAIIRFLLMIILFTSTASICIAQTDADTLKGEKKGRKEVFVDPSGSFVIFNVVKMNLLLPGSGNIIYAAGAKEDSHLMRGLTLMAGIWSVYSTSAYIHSYLGKNGNTPTRQRTQLFLLSYVVGNILNYKRLIMYNRKIGDKHKIEFNNGYKDGYLYVVFIYHF